MSEKKIKHYTAEFKESAVKLAVESDLAINTTARELGMKENTLYNWVNHFHKSDQAHKGSAKKEHNDEHVYDELKRLRRENAKLKEERAILKKAAAFFAKECP